MSLLFNRKLSNYAERKMDLVESFILLRGPIREEDDEDGNLENTFNILSEWEELLYQYTAYKSYLDLAKTPLSLEHQQLIRNAETLIQNIEKKIPIPYLIAEVQSLAIIRRELHESAKEAGKIYLQHEATVGIESARKLNDRAPSPPPSPAPKRQKLVIVPPLTESSLQILRQYPELTNWREHTWSKEHVRCIFQGHALKTSYYGRIDCIRKLLQRRVNVFISKQLVSYLLLHYDLRSASTNEVDTVLLKETFDEAYALHKDAIALRKYEVVRSYIKDKMDYSISKSDAQYGSKFRQFLDSVYGICSEPEYNYQEFEGKTFNTKDLANEIQGIELLANPLKPNISHGNKKRHKNKNLSRQERDDDDDDDDDDDENHRDDDDDENHDESPSSEGSGELDKEDGNDGDDEYHLSDDNEESYTQPSKSNIKLRISELLSKKHDSLTKSIEPPLINNKSLSNDPVTSSVNQEKVLTSSSFEASDSEVEINKSTVTDESLFNNPNTKVVDSVDLNKPADEVPTDSLAQTTSPKIQGSVTTEQSLPANLLKTSSDKANVADSVDLYKKAGEVPTDSLNTQTASPKIPNNASMKQSLPANLLNTFSTKAIFARESSIEVAAKLPIQQSRILNGAPELTRSKDDITTNSKSPTMASGSSPFSKIIDSVSSFTSKLLDLTTNSAETPQNQTPNLSTANLPGTVKVSSKLDDMINRDLKMLYTEQPHIPGILFSIQTYLESVYGRKILLSELNDRLLSMGLDLNAKANVSNKKPLIIEPPSNPSGYRNREVEEDEDPTQNIQANSTLDQPGMINEKAVIATESVNVSKPKLAIIGHPNYLLPTRISKLSKSTDSQSKSIQASRKQNKAAVSTSTKPGALELLTEVSPAASPRDSSETRTPSPNKLGPLPETLKPEEPTPKGSVAITNIEITPETTKKVSSISKAVNTELNIPDSVLTSKTEDKRIDNNGLSLKTSQVPTEIKLDPDESWTTDLLRLVRNALDRIPIDTPNRIALIRNYIKQTTGKIIPDSAIVLKIAEFEISDDETDDEHQYEKQLSHIVSSINNSMPSDEHYQRKFETLSMGSDFTFQLTKMITSTVEYLSQWPKTKNDSGARRIFYNICLYRLGRDGFKTGNSDVIKSRLRDMRDHDILSKVAGDFADMILSD